MEELLNLYGQHETVDISTPVIYSRAKYNTTFGIRKFRDEDDRWEGNEDKQLSKYYKMVEGMNRWEKSY